MDADRALLSHAEGGQWGWRLYTWLEPAVTLGMSQTPEADLMPGCPIGYAMRPTGGRGVLHGHDLTLGLAIPLADLGLPHGSRSLRQAYRPAAKWIIAALNDCGVQACLGEDLPSAHIGGHGADCFAHVANNDIVSPVTRRKICGCALRMTESAVLLQASLPIKAPVTDPHQVFAQPALLPPTDVDEAAFRAALASRRP